MEEGKNEVPERAPQAKESAHVQTAAGEANSHPPAESEEQSPAPQAAAKVTILARNVANAPILKTTQVWSRLISFGCEVEIRV
jgi:hypothetical protein